MPDNPTPEMLKRMRMDPPSSFLETPPSDTASVTENSRPAQTRKASVRDEEEEEEADERDANDRDFAPGNDADYFVEEDDEGRFFGGGLTDEQKNILSISGTLLTFRGLDLTGPRILQPVSQAGG